MNIAALRSLLSITPCVRVVATLSATSPFARERGHIGHRHTIYAHSLSNHRVLASFR